MTRTSSPSVVGTWLRNIEPNLPAPMRPTRTGRPASARARSRSWRNIARSGCGSGQAGVPAPAPALSPAPTSSVRQSSASGSMGAKSRWAIHALRWKRRMWLSTWQSDR